MNKRHFIPVTSMLAVIIGCTPIAMTEQPESVSASRAASSASSAAKAPVNPPYTAAEEQKYNDRFDALVASFTTGIGLDSYDLLKPVSGKPDMLLGSTAAAKTIDPAALKTANQYADETNSHVLMVYRNGILENEQYFGDTDADTLLNSKSFAKPVTAIAIGRALALGHIASLDDPVAKYITAWQSDPQKSKMLVRHLLDMRTGFLPQAAAFTPTDILNRSYLHPRHDDIIIYDYPLVNDPGVRYDYSNATSEMVAPLIEAATGQQYETFLSEHILQPIGAAGGQIWMNRPDGTAHSGCCLLLPARDWLRLSVLLLNEGQWGGQQLLPKGYVNQMRQATPQNPYYGMGVWLAGDYIEKRGIANPDRGESLTLHSAPYAASDLYLFDGNANQVSYIVPSEGLVILRMGKAPPKGSEWDNSKLPNLIINGIKQDRGTSVPQAASQTGPQTQ